MRSAIFREPNVFSPSWLKWLWLIVAGLALALAALCPASCLAQAPASIDTNLYVINFTGKGTLKDVFDSGLRPKRWDSSLISECLVEDKLLRFVITNNYMVTLYADTCTFKVNANGSLRSVWAESPYLTIEQARRWMLPVVQTFGKSPQALENYLKLVTAGDRNVEMQMRASEGSSSFGVGTPSPAPESDLPFLGVELRWRWNRELPTQIILRIEWERRLADMHSPDKPPSAPVGYEQFPIRTDAPFAEAKRTIGGLPAWVERH